MTLSMKGLVCNSNHYTQCRILHIIMLSVIIPSIIMLNVVAPQNRSYLSSFLPNTSILPMGTIHFEIFLIISLFLLRGRPGAKLIKLSKVI